MERELKAERAAAGRSSAKARGKTGGRPRTDVRKLDVKRQLFFMKIQRKHLPRCVKSPVLVGEHFIRIWGRNSNCEKNNAKGNEMDQR